jgi:DNA-binding Xre family transcriptional regulator
MFALNIITMCIRNTINTNSKSLFLQAFGEHIKSLRQQREMSQGELADKCRTNIRKIGRTERGEYDFKFSSLMVLCIGLELNIEDILKFDFPKHLYDEFWMEE